MTKLCCFLNNAWETGAYAMPKVRVTAQTEGMDEGRTVKDAKSGTTYKVSDGLIVAAIYTGDNLSYNADSVEDYQIVYGDPLHGWTVGGSGTAGIIDAAQKIEESIILNPDEPLQGLYRFSMDSCGAFTANIENLPGSIQNYTWWSQGTGGKFMGAYFFVEGATSITDIAKASTDQIHLLDSSEFMRDFSTVIYAPNIQNRLLVQKVDAETGEPLAGATFELYKQEDVTIQGDGYEIKEGAKSVDRCTTEESFEISDSATIEGAAAMAGIPNNETEVSNGTGIPKGKYYLIETAAPEGYEKNPKPVEVVVDDSGIYINAGDEKDNIEASIGVGKIVKSMVQFATDDGIDATLHDITATLQVAESYDYDEGNTDWKNAEQSMTLSYETNNAPLEYGPVKEGGPTTLSYDSGWGRLNVTQAESTASEGNTVQNLGEQSLNNLYSFTKMVTVGDTKTDDPNPPTPSTTANLEITKTVTGDGWPEGASFDFTLSGKGGAPMPADTTLTVEQPASGDTATASFDTITFEEPGSYVYTITETAGNVEGMTYDDQTLTATVDVKDTDGKLSAKVTYTSDDGDNGEKAQTFVNDYDEPSTPPTPPDGGDEDKPTPPDLNTVDHYLYIEGYPENYWTGEPSWDESVWPVKPQGDITRAEVATIFYRLLKEDVRDDIETTVNDFTDVNADDWFNVTVSSLANMGVVKGYEDGSFRPNEPITRAEFAAIAVRFFDAFEAKYEPGTFTDVTGDEWFADAIAAAEELGLIGGYEDGSVRPNNNITRAETCAIVNRVLHRQPHEDHLGSTSEMRTWPDNQPGAWYYADMQEATNGHEYEWIEENGQKFEDWTEVLPDYDWTGR